MFDVTDDNLPSVQDFTESVEHLPSVSDFIEELPRNPGGKILRRELRAPYWEGRDRNVS